MTYRLSAYWIIGYGTALHTTKTPPHEITKLREMIASRERKIAQAEQAAE